ncbi:MAG: hypothetical protein HPY55_04460 [Firmicutes bacterium]|nr:hypothetical protein [Bacillota bacterium]
MLSAKFKQALREGRAVVGCTVSINSPEIVEACGLVGFDFAFIDAEHAPFNERECQTLVMAADVVSMASLIRTPDNNPRQILKLMDIGASGIIVPDVETAEDASRAVKAVKYVPLGERGLSSVRSARYSLGGSLGDYTAASNAESVVICMVESKRAVENIDEILDCELVDGVIIGTTDLSNSFGVAGQRNSPEVNKAVEHVVSRARAVGKPYGAVVRGDENPKQYLEQGYTIIIGSGMGFFTKSARGFVRDFKSFGAK